MPRRRMLLASVAALAVYLSMGACRQNEAELNRGDSSPHPFSRSEKETRELIDKANTLKVGDMEKDVVAKLGPPSLAYTAGPKAPRDAGPKWHVLTYYVRQRDIHMSRDSDSALQLWFGEDGRLARSVPKNLPGVNGLP